MAHDCPYCGALCKCDGSEVIQPPPAVCVCDFCADHGQLDDDDPDDPDLEGDLDDYRDDDEDDDPFDDGEDE